MNWQTILTAVSFATATMILLIGVVLLTGVFLPTGMAANYRYTLGAIMTLYASYRIGLILYRVMRTRRDGGATDSTNVNEREGPGDA
jgi:hypothetical protein